MCMPPFESSWLCLVVARSCERSGDHDLTVPFSGTQTWIRSLNFSIVDDWRAWHLDGQAAGSVISFDALVFSVSQSIASSLFASFDKTLMWMRILVILNFMLILLDQSNEQCISYFLARFTITYANNLTFATIKVCLVDWMDYQIQIHIYSTSNNTTIFWLWM